MGARYLTDLADVLRAAGLAVVEVGDWEARARGSGGFEGDRPWCVMWHHTASDTSPENDVSYIVDGSPDAPLANLYLDRTGTVWVCAAGATNTNGKGDQQLMSRGLVPADQMNTHAIGIEAANDGIGQLWPQEQIDAYFAVNNALTAAYGLHPDDCCTHETYAPGRKIDPATDQAVMGPWMPQAVTTSGTWSVDDIRAECWARAGATPPTPTPPSEEDAMRIIILQDKERAAVLITGHIGTWLDPGRYNAYHWTYPSIVDEEGDVTWLANVVMTGPLPTGVDESQVWEHLP